MPLPVKVKVVEVPLQIATVGEFTVTVGEVPVLVKVTVLVAVQFFESVTVTV